MEVLLREIYIPNDIQMEEQFADDTVLYPISAKCKADQPLSVTRPIQFKELICGEQTGHILFIDSGLEYLDNQVNTLYEN